MKRLVLLTTLCLVVACGGDDSDQQNNLSQPDAAGADAGGDMDDDNDGGGMFEEPIGSDELVFDGETFAVDVFAEPDGLRRYEASTTYRGLDENPTSITIRERADRPRLRSGGLAFDALFALAVQEADENAVEQISDGAFANGEGVPCSCYETGAKWNYVWTRDTAYAVDLGLRWIDPRRAKRSLDFKLSERKQGGGLQIVQDTGTGGSWPVSSDRVSWVVGADGLDAFLPADEGQAFDERVSEALANTTALDRDVVYDSRAGLYRGEQSFLDWREQSYPRWTATDTRHIAQSHALSTNILHAVALEKAGRIEEAEQLREAIVETFWDEDAGLYRSMTGTELDGAALAKYDLLGNSLAVLYGFPNAQQVVQSYPYGANGAPVIWPQLPRIPIYHNRGQWPFVTAYALRAAAQTQNTSVVDRNLDTLVRGAALNLSNLENYEFLSGAPYVEDGEFSGPVVNSRRQLWSVAGYIGAIVEVMMGIGVDRDGRLTTNPFITPSMHRNYFPGSTAVRIENLRVGDDLFSLTIELPPQPEEGVEAAYRYDFPDVPSQDDPPFGPGDHTIRVVADPDAEPGAITEIADPSDFRNIFAPLEPTGLTVAQAAAGTGVDVSWDEPEPGVVYDLYRDGEVVAEDLTQTSWQDSVAPVGESPCYTVVAKFPTGHESHPTEPQCWFGELGSRVQIRDVWTMAADGGAWSSDHGRPHIGNWGDPSHVVRGAPFQPRWTGLHAVQIVYGNGANGFTTGITSAVKRLTVDNVTDGTSQTRWVVMPQLADWARWEPSTIHYMELDASKIYRWRLDDAVNMTYFAHFESYTGGAGGGPDPFNAANIHALELLPMSGQAVGPPTRSPVPLNGTDDLGKYASEAVVTPGVPLQSWSRFALDWDDRDLFVTLVTEAFEGDYEPMMLYFGDGDPSTGSTTGMEYSGQTAALPFAADWAITLRPLSDDGTAAPWNGIFEWDGQNWRRQRRFKAGRSYWLAGDRHAISVRLPRATFLGATTLQMAGHVVYAQPGNEWKETVPPSHTPWMPSTSGYYTFDLSQPDPLGSWTVR